MQLHIKRALDRLPGGMMIVPLVIGSVIITGALHTAQFFGSFTGALFTGALPILAVFYVCKGSTISVGMLPKVARKGGAASVIVTRLLVPVVTAGWANTVRRSAPVVKAA